MENVGKTGLKSAHNLALECTQLMEDYVDLAMDELDRGTRGKLRWVVRAVKSVSHGIKKFISVGISASYMT